MASVWPEQALLLKEKSALENEPWPTTRSSSPVLLMVSGSVEEEPLATPAKASVAGVATMPGEMSLPR